jgi:glycosyltransferase involved in cell wall biosynthesis
VTTKYSANPKNRNNQDIAFAILSFEGPDPYSHAGGLGSRVTELANALSSMGFETHLFFVGDPHLPGHEPLKKGKLHFHRWCQWISRYHPGGVYDGEEGKLYDWDRSVPPWLEKELIEDKVSRGGSVIIIGEEWQTVSSMLALSQIIDKRGWHQLVHLLWNANNTFSFERINWEELKKAVTVTTVSRFMKHVMKDIDVEARVIPNGISEKWLKPIDQKAYAQLSEMFQRRLALVKAARWDPDKNWDIAVDAVAELKRFVLKPLFLARGGHGEQKGEIIKRALRRKLNVVSVDWKGSEAESFIEAIRPALSADMIDLQGYLSFAQRRTLYHAADAVLANSGIEPFGLVGLETMAVGGVAFVGCTGEDYATPGFDAISIQTDDPWEVVHHAVHLDSSQDYAQRLRKAAKRTAQHYTWKAVIRRVLLPFLGEIGVRFSYTPEEKLPEAAEAKLEEGVAVQEGEPAEKEKAPQKPSKHRKPEDTVEPTI